MAKHLRRLETPADPEVLPQFRETLLRAEFTVPAIAALLGSASVTELKSRSARLLYATRSGSAQDTFIRLFVAGVPVAIEQVRAAVGPALVSALAEAGVLRVSSRTATPLVGILPHDELVLAADQPFHSGTSPDYVPGITDSSVFLELFTIRRPLASAMDFGTGFGLHALRASLHADSVTAVDVNRRALDFARFNAALNGCSNIEFLHGDGFQAVSNRRFDSRQFDLIVGNLPFAITPSARYTYRDSGMRLDDFAHRVIDEAPGLLREGGYCQLLCQWIETKDHDWHDRLQEWFDGSGCDAWVMKNDSLPPDAYAEKWIADTEPGPPEAASRLFENWMEYYSSEGITAIHSGAIAMRRRSGNNWLRMDEGPDRACSPFGDAVLRAFAIGDYLRDLDGEALLGERLHVSRGIHLVQRCDWSAGEWRPDGCQLRFHTELEYIANVDQYVSKLVARCTGHRTVRELIQELASETGIPEDRLGPACLQLIRGLIERGFLLPNPVS
jgi:methylase of polypeptide subunit release factors